MSSPSRDFVTADLRGVKAALVARATAERVSVSVVVRRAVERELGCVAEPLKVVQATRPCASVKLSLRVTPGEAGSIAEGARREGLSRGAFIASLVSNATTSSAATPSRPDRLAALTASTAELSTLTRNIHHLTVLLRQGEALAAMEYLPMLAALGNDVRAHLSLAAGVLADLRRARVRHHADAASAP